jgi:hypothetical protein
MSVYHQYQFLMSCIMCVSPPAEWAPGGLLCFSVPCCLTCWMLLASMGSLNRQSELLYHGVGQQMACTTIDCSASAETL